MAVRLLSVGIQEPLLRRVMPELDMIRGVAISSVLLLHGFYWPFSGLRFTRPAKLFMDATQPGWVGVNLFFVLSGFLITGILIDSKNSPHYYRRFYTRRALRILPPYYLILILLGVLRHAKLSYLGLSFVYLSNITVLFGVAEDYGPLWSLAVEEHFYIFWPAVVRYLTRTSLAIFAAGICIVTPAVRAWAFYHGQVGGLATYTWFVADGLASGGMLAILLRTSISRKHVTYVACLLVLLGLSVGIAGAPYGILTRTRLIGAALQHTVIDLVCSGVLLLVLLVGTSSYRRYVNGKVLRFLGYLSYGLYLVHLMVFRCYDAICPRFWPWLVPVDYRFGFVVLRFAIAASFSVLLAYLSRTNFEEKFLRLKSRHSPDQPEAESHPVDRNLVESGLHS